MAKHIILKFTERELFALTSCIDSLSAIMEECVDTQREIKAVDRMLKRNGLKRDFE